MDRPSRSQTSGNAPLTSAAEQVCISVSSWFESTLNLTRFHHRLGQATVQLLANDEHSGFRSVLAIDPSANMIQVATESIPSQYKSRIEFKQSAAEELSFIEDGTVDLVTAGEHPHLACSFSHRTYISPICALV
jgi:hypothetical protein